MCQLLKADGETPFTTDDDWPRQPYKAGSVAYIAANAEVTILDKHLPGPRSAWMVGQGLLPSTVLTVTWACMDRHTSIEQKMACIQAQGQVICNLALTVTFGLVRSRILNPSEHETLARTHVCPHFTKHDPSDSGASLPVSNEHWMPFCEK